MNDYPIQKALHLSDAKKVKKFKFGEYAIMEKLDGWYCYIDYIDGKWGILRTSVGREIPSLNHLTKIFQDKVKNGSLEPCRLIFEATIANTPFHIANGIFNRKSELATETILYLHDLIKFSTSIPFSSRLGYCRDSMPHLQSIFGDTIQLAPVLAEGVHLEERAVELFQEVTSRGGEGIILKELNAGYHFGKRNSTLMKIKEAVTKDLLVVGLVEGKGKYQGTTGALRVRTKSGVSFDIGCGVATDFDRDCWWNAYFNTMLGVSSEDNIVGKVVEVVAMKELPGDMLREPRFKAIRWDKTAEDID